MIWTGEHMADVALKPGPEATEPCAHAAGETSGQAPSGDWGERTDGRTRHLRSGAEEREDDG